MPFGAGLCYTILNRFHFERMSELETIALVFLNAIGAMFILATVLQCVKIRRAAKTCKPIHKHPVTVKQTTKRRIERGFFAGGVVLWIGVVTGLFLFSIHQIAILYGAAIASLSSFYPLFRQGKIGENGIAVADRFIPWNEVEEHTLHWPPVTHADYPFGHLDLRTSSGSRFKLVVDNRDSKIIVRLLETKLAT